MPRKGKLKYKDVVKKPYASQKKNPKKLKPRKTYSLYANSNNNPKRKFVHQKSSFEPRPKHQKIDKPPPKQDNLTSSEEEGDIADLDSLLNTFRNTNKKSLAIESSSDSESEIEENNDDNEKLGKEVDESDSEIESEHGEKEDEDIQISAEKVDEVDDDEEEELEDIEIGTETNLADEHDDNSDPFNRHFLYDLHDTILDSLQNITVSTNNFTESWPKLGKLNINIPKSKITSSETSEFTIAEKKVYAQPSLVPKRMKSSNFENVHIKTQIINNLPIVNKNITDTEYFTSLQEEIFSVLNNYQDLYYPGRTFKNSEEIRFTYCLHAVNHILKTRLKVVHHNSKLNKKDDVPEEFRDQGLVRPKVLMILPFKDSAYKTIQMIINILFSEDKGNVMNKNRFLEDYTGNELYFPKKNPKPEDYEQIFQGNTSDDFKMGITVTKKSLKLYADFYSSDIIIASPLGLRMIIGAEGETERDFDFLASIELLIMDQTEIFLMQNWDHILHVFNHIHMQPKNSHGTDFSRVRTWSLNGWAKYYRQTFIVSSLNLPEINAIFNKKCQNYSGKVKVVNSIDFGSISQVVVQIPHVFHRFDCKNAADAIEARFEFFVSKILPQQKEPLMKQTLIFIPSYFDYVRVRNYFKKEDIGFVQICEYSKEGKVARARDMFYHGDAHFLLYTERYHFFNRKRIKGIRHIVFYQPPMFPHFYYEMCNLMHEANLNKKIDNVSNMTVTVLYSKYDIYQLSGMVGTEKSSRMVQSDRKVHLMVTGGD